ncbi:putative bifunctional diguanylate cyclase/phosphodiesterase [Sphingomonas sp. TX0543]|uniref:putative bifunctional diguanylate cyclase/phosphodiesterase n=1 Tax=unclassified Sphingomonas TaxID=196159 RepID=UPI0010F65C33|nr:EAL domain-containing protein [Sphingomonas sp. 3P27F8]
MALPSAMVAAAVLAASTISISAAVLFAVTAIGLLAWAWRLLRKVDNAAQRIDAVRGDASSSDSLEDGLAAIERKMAALNHRMAAAHPISGLPVREALLAQMNSDRTGMLGVIAFTDFDRLTAFDPALGERIFAASAARLRSMLPPDRFIAQIDRGHVGLWFGGAVAVATAQAELEAIGYALGEAIEDNGTTIIPQIGIRQARFDEADEIEPGALIARTLALFALPAGAIPKPDQPAVDYADLARDRYALEQDLRQAISRRELRLEFQPLIDAGAGRVCGAEALIRWNHVERGAVPPARFIPIVEAMGMASEIGMWALNAAAREAQRWATHGLEHVRVAVNVSGLQLERDDLPILVQRTLERHELGPSALEIELTESVATSDAEHCRQIFKGLRAIGVKLAVDDFGTGYSGFSSLRTLAFDKIKIDREFVTGVDTRTDSQAICQSIIALGRGLGIRVLAEGVERREEYEWLRRHGCQHFQGYYFARPMRSEAFVAFVRDSARLTEMLRLGVTPNQIEEKLRA